VLASIGQAFSTTGQPEPVPEEYQDVINPSDAALYSKYEFKRDKMMMIEGNVRANDQYDIITSAARDDHMYAELPDGEYDAIPEGFQHKQRFALQAPIYEEALIRRTYGSQHGRGGDNALYSHEDLYEVGVNQGVKLCHNYAGNQPYRNAAPQSSRRPSV
jgi:hypothetical protein